MRIKVYATIVVSVLCALIGCDDKKSGNAAPGPVWRYDRESLEKIIPFVNPIEHCAWEVSVDADRSGGLVPAPSRMKIRGYAVLTEDGFKKLNSRYSSKKIEGNEILQRIFPQGNSIKGDIYESLGIEEKLSHLSTYHSGKVFFIPDTRAVYFELFKN